MSAKFIPVEHLASFQKWQFAGIDEARDSESDVQEPQESPVVEEEVQAIDAPPVVETPTAEDIGRIYHDAHREGYEAGLVEGLEAGHAEGYEAGHVEGLEAGRKSGHEAAVNAAQPLVALFDGIAASVEQVRQEIAQDVVGLALEIAGQLLRSSLKLNPGLVASIVRQAMENIPPGAQHPHIHLHPDDATLVRGLLKEDLVHGAWKIIEDHRIERGGCLIETSTAELDATLPGRWKRIAQALGQDHSWIEHDK